MKITIIGAGSVSFCPGTINDILLSDALCAQPGLAICLMDIRPEALPPAQHYATQAAAHLQRRVTITATTDLEQALDGARFVVVAIEKDRYLYWSQDQLVMRKYGFKQVLGENGGPGSMFHTLRNIPPMLHIARTMERLCPDAWLFNFTNPEAKLVEAVLKLTKVKAVGLCHGTQMGIEQLANILEMDEEDLDVDACGLNHFGWFTRIAHKHTGQDLYPELKERERNMNWLTHWDEWGLARLMLRTYGLYPYPGTSHIGEYIGWAEGLSAHTHGLYFYDPAHENPWARGVAPHNDYTFELSGKKPPRYPRRGTTFEDMFENMEFSPSFAFNPQEVWPSGEVAIAAMEGMITGDTVPLASVNVMNQYIPNLPPDLVIEVSAYADGTGIHGRPMPALPAAIAQMIRTQATIHQLVLEAYQEQSRNKLLQAMLLDPTVHSYHNAVYALNEMCELQKDVLPPLVW